MELREKIYEHFMIDRLEDRTIDFENDPSGYYYSSLEFAEPFLPLPLFKSRALLRASKQTRADFIATCLLKAHIRLIVHDLTGLAASAFQ